MANIKILECEDQVKSLDLKGSFVAKLNGSNCKTSTALFDVFKIIFDLPDFFGKNLDALYDCLMDLEWITQNKVVLIIENFEDLLINETNDPDLIGDLMLLLDEVGLSWQMADDDQFTPKTFICIIVESEKAKILCEENDIEFEVIN